MVAGLILSAWTSAASAWINVALLAADQADPLLKRLDPQRRSGVLLALAALVLLGLAMIALVWLGAHCVRRIARQRPRPTDRSSWGRTIAGTQTAVDDDLGNDEARNPNDE